MIHLTILENDIDYLNRVSETFLLRYPDKLEIGAFSNEEAAYSNLSGAFSEVFVASGDFNIDASRLPEACAFAYLADMSNVETLKGHPAIFKFQKVEALYKAILGLFAEKTESRLTVNSRYSGNVKFKAFLSASGGAGSSSLAVAYAKRKSLTGQSILYLNLEQLGDSNLYFTGNQKSSFSDVMIALKSNKSNLALKLESSVSQDPIGAYFFAPARIALDMSELHADDLSRLLQGLTETGRYNEIVLDAEHCFSDLLKEIFRVCDTIIFVIDGSEVSLVKFTRIFEALQALERDVKAPIIAKLALFYNKFSNKTGLTLENIHIREIGGAPKYEHATNEQVISQLMMMNGLDSI